MSESASHTLSEDIKALLLEAGERDLSIQEIEFMLRGRGFALLIMLLAAPFLIPNVPGLSTPFGAAITMMGARLAFGRKPWLPKFVLAKRLSSATLQKILGMLLKISLRLERMVKPRMCFLHRWPGTMNLIGVGIASGGFFLALPLPIPLTNTLPAISILLLTAGMMEEDGVCVLIGYVMGILAWVYLIAWLLLGKVGVEWLHRLF